MVLRRGAAAGRDLEQEHAGEIAAAFEMKGRALHAVARPWHGLDREGVDREILMDEDAFLLDPLLIGIDA